MDALKPTIRVRVDEPMEHYNCQRCSFETSKKHNLLDHYRNIHQYSTNVVFYCGQCGDEFPMLKDCNFHFARCEEVPKKRIRLNSSSQDQIKEEEETIKDDIVENIDEAPSEDDADSISDDRLADYVAQNGDESNTDPEAEEVNIPVEPEYSAEAEDSMDVDPDDNVDQADEESIVNSQSTTQPSPIPDADATDVEPPNPITVPPSDPLTPFAVLIDLPAVQLKFECPICGSDCYQRSAVINHCRTSHHRDCAVSFRCSGCKELFSEQKDCSAHTRSCGALREELERSDRQRVRHHRSSGRDGALLSAGAQHSSKGSKSPITPKYEDEEPVDEVGPEEEDRQSGSSSSAPEEDETENKVECNISVPIEGSRSLYSCPVCIYTAYVRSELTYHYRAKHGGPPRIVFVCRGCGRTDPDFKQMRRHFGECEGLLQQEQSRERRSITRRSEQLDVTSGAADSSVDSSRHHPKLIEMLCEFPRADDSYKCPKCGKMLARRHLLEEHCREEHGSGCDWKYRCTYCKDFFDSSHKCVSHLKNCMAKLRQKQKAEAANGKSKSLKSQPNGEKATKASTSQAAAVAPTDRKTRAAQQQPTSKDPVDLNYPNSESVANTVYFNVPMRGKHECPKCAQTYVKRSQFNAHFSKQHLAGQECITYYRCIGCRSNYELQRICNEHITNCDLCDPYRRAFDAYCAARDQNDDQRPMAEVVAEAMVDERRLGPSIIPQLNELRNILPASERQRNRNIAAVADRRNWEQLFYEEFGKIIIRQPAAGPQFVALMPLILELTGNVVRSLSFPNHR